MALLDDIEIGTDDVVTVACAAVGDLLSGILVDGKSVPVRLGQVYPEDAADLPVIQVYSTSENYAQGAGRQGNRMERIDAVITATIVFALPITKLAELDRKVGRVRAEVKERIAANPYLKVEGSIWASDLAVRDITKGLAGAGKATVNVNQMRLGCVIHAREGARFPAHYQGD